MGAEGFQCRHLGSSVPQISDKETCCPSPTHPYRAATSIAVLAAAASRRQLCQVVHVLCEGHVLPCLSISSCPACFAVVFLNGWPSCAPHMFALGSLVHAAQLRDFASFGQAIYFVRTLIASWTSPFVSSAPFRVDDFTPSCLHAHASRWARVARVVFRLS